MPKTLTLRPSGEAVQKQPLFSNEPRPVRGQVFSVGNFSYIQKSRKLAVRVTGFFTAMTLLWSASPALVYAVDAAAPDPHALASHVCVNEIRKKFCANRQSKYVRERSGIKPHFTTGNSKNTLPQNRAYCSQLADLQRDFDRYRTLKTEADAALAETKTGAASGKKHSTKLLGELSQKLKALSAKHRETGPRLKKNLKMVESARSGQGACGKVHEVVSGAVDQFCRKKHKQYITEEYNRLKNSSQSAEDRKVAVEMRVRERLNTATLYKPQAKSSDLCKIQPAFVVCGDKKASAYSRALNRQDFKKAKLANDAAEKLFARCAANLKDNVKELEETSLKLARSADHYENMITQLDTGTGIRGVRAFAAPGVAPRTAPDDFGARLNRIRKGDLEFGGAPKKPSARLPPGAPTVPTRPGTTEIVRRPAPVEGGGRTAAVPGAKKGDKETSGDTRTKPDGKEDTVGRRDGPGSGGPTDGPGGGGASKGPKDSWMKTVGDTAGQLGKGLAALAPLMGAAGGAGGGGAAAPGRPSATPVFQNDSPLDVSGIDGANAPSTNGTGALQVAELPGDLTDDKNEGIKDESNNDAAAGIKALADNTKLQDKSDKPQTTRLARKRRNGRSAAGSKSGVAGTTANASKIGGVASVKLTPSKEIDDFSLPDDLSHITEKLNAAGGGGGIDAAGREPGAENNPGLDALPGEGMDADIEAELAELEKLLNGDGGGGLGGDLAALEKDPEKKAELKRAQEIVSGKRKASKQDREDAKRLLAKAKANRLYTVVAEHDCDSQALFFRCLGVRVRFKIQSNMYPHSYPEHGSTTEKPAFIGRN